MPSCKLSVEGIAIAEEKFKNSGKSSKRTFADLLGFSHQVAYNFFDGKPVRSDNFETICEELELNPEEVWEKNEEYPPNPEPLPENLEIYIDRPPLESCCCEEVTKPGALIRIKAPPKLGKTLLKNRILAHCQGKGYRVVDLNLRLAEGEDLSNLDRFLQWFGISVTQQLRLCDRQVGEYWDDHLGSGTNKCQGYFEENLLGGKQPLVLAIDDIDRLFPHSTIADSFLGILRTWHERGKKDSLWKNFRLVMTYIQEYSFPNPDHSPFNVGVECKLRPFNLEERQDLLKQWDREKDEALSPWLERVGGHPYLLQDGLESLKWGKTVEEIVNNASTEFGIYSQHLQRHWNNVRRNLPQYPDLLTVLEEVMKADLPVPLPSSDASKLLDLGLIVQQDGGFVPYCPLYRLYFQERLTPP